MRPRLLVATALLPSLVAAAGYETEYPDNGARALGRGGAFTARADDPSAVYYNPAGLAKLAGVDILLSSNFISLEHTFDPDSTRRRGYDVDYAALEEEEGVFTAPMLAAHFDFDALRGFDFALSFYGPSALGHRRYSDQIEVDSVSGPAAGSVEGDAGALLRTNGFITETRLLLVFSGLSVAYAVLPELRVGVTAQIASFDGDIRQGIGGAVPAETHLQVQDLFTPTAVFGVQYAPIRAIELGFSVRPEFTVEAEGTATLTRYDTTAGGAHGPWPFADCETQDCELPVSDADGTPNDAASFTFIHPLVIRAAVRYAHVSGGSELFDVELDYIFQRGSAFDAYAFRFEGTRTVVEGAEVALPPIDDLRHYEDTHGLRLGGDVRLVPERLWLRAGGTYETGASPDAYTHLDFPGLDQWSAHVGVGARFDVSGVGVDLDLAYAYVGLVERRVDDSDVRAIDVQLSRTDADGNVVPLRDEWQPVLGDGTFSGRYHVAAASATVHL